MSERLGSPIGAVRTERSGGSPLAAVRTERSGGSPIGAVRTKHKNRAQIAQRPSRTGRVRTTPATQGSVTSSIGRAASVASAARRSPPPLKKPEKAASPAWLEGLMDKTMGLLAESSDDDGLETFERVEDWITSVEDIFEKNPNHMDRREALKVQTEIEKEVGFGLWDTSPKAREKAIEVRRRSSVIVHERFPDEIDAEIKRALEEEKRESDDGEPEEDCTARLEAYQEHCLAKGKPALPQVLASLEDQGAPVLDLSNRALGCAGVQTFCDSLQHMRGLTWLDLSSNSIREEGCMMLAMALKDTCYSLTSLNMNDNRIGHEGCRALADEVLDRDSLTSLSIAKNGLGDPTIAYLVERLRKTSTLEKLDIAYNKIADTSCFQLAHLVHRSRTLKSLNCNWAHMRAMGAIEFASKMQLNKSITDLDLSWNGFGDLLPCSALAEVLKSTDCLISTLNLSYNRIQERSASVLSIRLETNKSLRSLILDGNPLGRSGCRRILSSCLGKDSDTSAERVFSSAGQREETSRTIVVSMEGCNIGMVSGSSFDPSEPGGDYSLDMADPYSQLVVRDLLKIQAAGRGAFVQGLTRLNGMPTKLEYEDLTLDPDVPTAGELTFRYVNLKQPPAVSERMPDYLFQSLVQAFKEDSEPEAAHEHGKQKKKMEGMAMFEVMLTGDTVLALDQAQTLLSLMRHRRDRVSFAAQVFHKVVGAGAGKALLQDLEESEREEVERILGPTSFAFSAENPTGHHRLDLSKREEREVQPQVQQHTETKRSTQKQTTYQVTLAAHEQVAMKLRQWRAAEDVRENILQLKFATHKGGPRDPLQRVWRNCTLSKERTTFPAHEKMPTNGILEVDFVAVSKPQDKDPHVQAINSDAWKELYAQLRDLEPVELVTNFRYATNFHVFKLAHVKQLLALLNTEHSALRVELVVAAWARTLDWHGYGSNNGMLRTALTISERKMLSHRLGLVNIFDPAMAVDYYELDMSNAEERFIVQELVHLATSEPGENCVNETLEGIDFETPAAWVTEVPRKGVYCTFYCREKQTIDNVRVAAQELHPNSFPPEVEQPVGTDWVQSAQCREIKRKMQECFPTAKAGFKMLDRDGGGSVDRKELAVGLFQLGVWLHPKELQTLFSMVDADNGGDVDEAEFIAFWDSH